MNLSLYNIEAELLEVLQLRDEVALDPDLTPPQIQEALDAIDGQIRAYVAAEIDKVDGIAAWIRECKMRAAVLLEEQRRVGHLVDQWLTRKERMEAVVISVMQEMKLKKLKGLTSTLRIQANPSSVEVDTPALLPIEYQRVKITMPLAVWADIQRALQNDRYDTLFAQVLDVAKVSESEPAKDKIADELKQDCPRCGGSGKLLGVMMPGGPMLAVVATQADACDACGGTGKRGVPGCHLVVDKVHLRTS